MGNLNGLVLAFLLIGLGVLGIVAAVAWAVVRVASRADDAYDALTTPWGDA